jgi:hypothetical protein
MQNNLDIHQTFNLFNNYFNYEKNRRLFRKEVMVSHPYSCKRASLIALRIKPPRGRRGFIKANEHLQTASEEGKQAAILQQIASRPLRHRVLIQKLGGQSNSPWTQEARVSQMPI